MCGAAACRPAASSGPSCQPEKHRERPVNREHHIIVEAADGGAELGAAHRLWTIHRYLRGGLQAVLIGWRDVDPRHGGVLKATGQR